ncbi:MAG: phosphoenolpyruvate--protein phosphotransferase [Eubacterium sp.]|nr:phosphoenolpyruvate--protein phosphotransferase [Eubacterium sp.]
MEVYRGKSVFQGVAIGRISLYRKLRRTVYYNIADPAAEYERFLQAQKTALDDLAVLHKKVLTEVGKSEAEIFEVHQIMLQDPDYVGSVEDMIKTQMINAEYAVAQTNENFFSRFSAMEDTYMQARAIDIRDISERLISILAGDNDNHPGAEEPAIIIADDLVPSEIMQMEREKIMSFVMVHGSVNSHTAILARTMGIPTITGVDMVLEEELDGEFAIVDGNTGYIYIKPNEEIIFTMQKKLQTEINNKNLLQAYKNKESVTLDGRSVRLNANIGNLHDLTRALQSGAEGIGLFRSEFLYLEKDNYPSEEEQFQAYRFVVEKMAGKRVIIRTLDIGADKKINYLNLKEEENPAMGLRGIRIYFKHPQVFRTQLRALLRTAAFGKISIMYPLITSVEEVMQIKRMVEEEKENLEKEHISYGELEQGIMIETPAAVMIGDLLAKHVDFFSIGTNDLSQYILAADRQNPLLDSFFDVHHPAVLRAIEQTVQNAHNAGIWCGICGELGADRELTKRFLKMGVDELSVSPENILPLRKLIREMNTQEFKKAPEK